MEQEQVRLTYDREADAAYIALVDIVPGEAVAQEEIALDDRESTIVLDFDRNGFLLGVEILGASHVLREELLTTATDITGEH
jgi:uncharacterized protein YuzE